MVALNIPASLPDYRLPLSLSTVRFEVWKVFLPLFLKVQELPIHITVYGCQVPLSGVMVNQESSHFLYGLWVL